jgi:hypothetical protein
MSNQAGLAIALLSLNCCLLLNCSACAQEAGKSSGGAITKSKRDETKEELSIADLKRRYDAAGSQFEKRAVCLEAIDQGIIRVSGAVSSVDAIFGRRFASMLPTREQAKTGGVVNFVPFVPADRPGRAGTAKGWDFMIDYDSDGHILDYFLGNTHKMMSEGEGKTPSTVMELRKLYQTAQSDDDRRAVCLHAIDEGVIQAGGPATVRTIDAIFGTHLAARLPKSKNVRPWGTVDLVPPSTSRRLKGSSRADRENRWFLAVQYDYRGYLLEYYMSNVHVITE